MNTITVDIFAEGDNVAVVGTTKGKGFQGVVKRHGFSGVGEQSHGQHDRQRAPGSIGNSSDASRVFKGMRMAGRMGGDRVKMKGLKVVKIFAEKNYILISGSVPGHNGSIVLIYRSNYATRYIKYKRRKTGRTLNLPEEIFGIEPNDHVIYLAVKQYQGAQRQGTHKVKTRMK